MVAMIESTQLRQKSFLVFLRDHLQANCAQTKALIILKEVSRAKQSLKPTQIDATRFFQFCLWMKSQKVQDWKSAGSERKPTKKGPNIDDLYC